MPFRIEDYDLSKCDSFESVFELVLEFYELKQDLEDFLLKLNIPLARDTNINQSQKALQSSITRDLRQLILFFTQD